MRARHGRTKTILIVEDDAEYRDFLFHVLGGSYGVRYATNGDDALVVAREDHPDLIILDVMLPGGMDGFSVFCELKKGSETKTIPVVFLTEVNRIMESEYNLNLLDRYFGSAPAAFLEKPIAPHSLLEEVRRILSGSGRLSLLFGG